MGMYDPVDGSYPPDIERTLWAVVVAGSANIAVTERVPVEFGPAKNGTMVSTLPVSLQAKSGFSTASAKLLIQDHDGATLIRQDLGMFHVGAGGCVNFQNMTVNVT